MKKILSTVSAAMLALLMLCSAAAAAQVTIPGQDAQQPPVIAAQQNQTAQAGGAGSQQNQSAQAGGAGSQQTETAAPAQQNQTAQAGGAGTQQPNVATPAQEPAAPKIFTTPDGVLSIKIPAGIDAWNVVQDPNYWFAVSDGTDWITVQHLSNGDPLPAPEIAGETWAQIFQVYYSTFNEVFVVTGYSADGQTMLEVRDAVCSFKVLKYDTLQRRIVDPAPQVREAAEVKYCIEPYGVNVRSNANTSSDIIGGVHYGDQINITGYVIDNGADTGWLQINHYGQTGYVHGSNFSTNKPPARTGNAIDLYAPEGGGVVVTVYELTDGRYVDDNGHYYSRASDTEFFDDYDAKWVLPAYFDDNPVGQNFLDFTMDMINEATGEYVTVRGLTQGGYVDESTGVYYEMEGGGGPHMYGSDGSVLIVPEEYYGEY